LGSFDENVLQFSLQTFMFSFSWSHYYFSGVPSHLVVVFPADFLGNSPAYFPAGPSQLCQAALPAAEPAHASLLQAERKHGKDPQLRLQVQQGRLVRPLPALKESQQTFLHGLPGKF
jgi:hypothetical protein